MTVGEKIKTIRQNNNLTQAKFAESLKVSQTHICKIESGYQEPSKTLLDLISLKYNIDYNKLIDNSESIAVTCESKNNVSIVGKFEIVSFEVFRASILKYHPFFSEEKIQKCYNNIVLPRRATSQSAGYDIYSPIDKIISPESGSTVIPLGIKSNFCTGWVLFIMPRSGWGFKYGLAFDDTVAVIDSDYEGQILLKLHAIASLEIKMGNRIAQGIFMPFGLVEGDEINASVNERGTGGFGSTGL